MLSRLLYKEFRLSAHETMPIFLGLSAMMLIPNYPYYITFFYSCLSVFFTCLGGRENNDIVYSLCLPIRKRDVVRGRFALVVAMQLLQLVCAIPFALLRRGFSLPDNQVGMEANLAFFGLSLGLLGLFNLVFFLRYYRAPERVGKAFIWGSAAVMLYICVMEAGAHICPYLKSLDNWDPAMTGARAIVLLGGAIVYALLTALAYRRAAGAFEKLDL